MKRTLQQINHLAISLLLIFSVAACTSAPAKKHHDYSYVYPQEPSKPLVENGSIYQVGKSITLFEDNRAQQIGDILTVTLSEKTKASKKANTSISKENTTGITAPTILGRGVTVGGTAILGASLAAANDFKGEADTDQSNSLSGSIAVTVIKILGNGNLMIRGEKRVTLNQGNEYIRVSGIIRPIDIGPDNSIASSKIADATLTYTGDGRLADVNEIGWLAAFFNKPIWPF